jgi:hypothetical protein
MKNVKKLNGLMPTLNLNISAQGVPMKQQTKTAAIRRTIACPSQVYR